MSVPPALQPPLRRTPPLRAGQERAWCHPLRVQCFIRHAIHVALPLQRPCSTRAGLVSGLFGRSVFLLIRTCDYSTSLSRWSGAGICFSRPRLYGNSGTFQRAAIPLQYPCGLTRGSERRVAHHRLRCERGCTQVLLIPGIGLDEPVCKAKHQCFRHLTVQCSAEPPWRQ